MRRRDNSTLILVTLSVILLAVVSVMDKVLGVIYAQHTGNKVVVIAAIIAGVLGLTALILSLAAGRSTPER